MTFNAIQQRAYQAVAAALPFGVDSRKITIEPGLSYLQSPIKAHDYAVGVMSAFGSVVEYLGVIRGLPAQSLTLNRRLCGLLLNSAQLQFLNGYSVMDTWAVGPDNGTYRAKDGRFVTMIGVHPHLRDGLLDYLNASNSAHAIQAEVEKKTAQQIEDEAAVLNLPVGVVRSPSEWLAHPQGAAVAKRPLVDIEQRGKAQQRRLGPAKYRPLEGTRVIELAPLVAGPTAGRLLAEQGADVIKIQSPISDWVLPTWLDTNWGKKSIITDIKSRSGRQRFVELLTGADVLIDAFAPGSLDRIGLDETALQAINPNLVHARVSYCPPGTPWGQRKGLEQIGQAVSGLMHVHSRDFPAPTLIAALINDYLTGYLTAIAAVAGLAQREASGGYWRVGASLAGCSTMATSLIGDRDAEVYAPISVADMHGFGIDQKTAYGTFTRLRSAIEFSHTPSMAIRSTPYLGTDPDTIGWTDASELAVAPVAPHYSSLIAREGRLRNLIECYGIEDRGDGGGGLSLASPRLLQYLKTWRES